MLQSLLKLFLQCKINEDWWQFSCFRFRVLVFCMQAQCPAVILHWTEPSLVCFSHHDKNRDSMKKAYCYTILWQNRHQIIHMNISVNSCRRIHSSTVHLLYKLSTIQNVSAQLSAVRRKLQQLQKTTTFSSIPEEKELKNRSPPGILHSFCHSWRGKTYLYLIEEKHMPSSMGGMGQVHHSLLYQGVSIYNELKPISEDFSFLILTVHLTAWKIYMPQPNHRWCFLLWIADMCKS